MGLEVSGYVRLLEPILTLDPALRGDLERSTKPSAHRADALGRLNVGVQAAFKLPMPALVSQAQRYLI